MCLIVGWLVRVTETDQVPERPALSSYPLISAVDAPSYREREASDGHSSYESSHADRNGQTMTLTKAGWNEGKGACSHSFD